VTGDVVTDWALELAENPNAYVPLRPGHERVVTDRYVFWFGGGDHPGWTVAQRFRFSAGEVDGVRAELHEHARARGRTAMSWEIGSSATPTDLVDRLLALGLERDEEFLRVGMALTVAPPEVPGVEVRRAETDDERQLAARIGAEVFGTPYVEPPAPDPGTVLYLAYVDGRPVARATGSFSEHGVNLSGGAVLPEARGRGAYRALVRARWEDAVARGTPLAVTDAGSQSRPILARLGFNELCTIRALIDRL
jgi:ribosomal protein S18 acetylase RimI-like enzyme